jgi:hypothetical protein
MIHEVFGPLLHRCVRRDIASGYEKKKQKMVPVRGFAKGWYLKFEGIVPDANACVGQRPSLVVAMQKTGT